MGIIGSFWNQALCWNKRGEKGNNAQNLVLVVALPTITAASRTVESDSEDVNTDSVINSLFFFFFLVSCECVDITLIIITFEAAFHSGMCMLMSIFSD